ncbi:MAG: radical SAM protein [Clostridia bacterium]|nr:radical SAM protein [Clostridia bacterium]
MDKIKRYIDCVVPISACNLRCHYCYITHNRLFDTKVFPFPKTAKEIRKAFSKERWEGTCLINLCAGGETLLSQETVELAKELLEEGHYVMIVTNGTISKSFFQISEFPQELLKHLFIKFSFQYLELVRMNILDRFFENVSLMKNHGVSFTIEITPSDELMPYIDDVIKICKEKAGAVCHVSIARDETDKDFPVLSKYSYDEYKKIWSVFDSNLFKFKSEIFYKKRKEFCYAGVWSFFVHLDSGDIYQCGYHKNIGNIYKDVSVPIEYCAVGNNCKVAHCFNGHSFLALGAIPELNTPTYTQLRNRVCIDGSEWLTEDVKYLFSSKLCESNEEYSAKQKREINKEGKESVPFSIKVKAAVKNALPESIVQKYDSLKQK